ncbi:NADP-dependent oxidoreductase [Hahella sp. KA22]|uniref:NADP-dependent oxidoreductase n=1 Tax=Hahella sp. KA22 TaxID=1628392 RepID=UPI000FDE518A|nr:NADP-dependent oxidoreductase [Hahella sp. KA22]AZZ92645.1 NADP-dependent oxidoreductase [Hahella sp. KA22]QAY56018.1 NADP-dependent oxidoreductase [Hahella sp. KA22]
MKALRIHSFGTPDQAQLQDFTPSHPGPGEILIRTEAASINPLDIKMIGGYMQPVFPVDLPYTPGTDIAGVVAETGPDVETFKAGDRVCGRLTPSAGGGFAEAAVAPAHDFCLMPADMSFEQAAALPTAAGTAWLALFDVGELRAGIRVLIHAAAGGVGAFAVQFAKQAGAYVIATASAKNHPLLKELGADECIDYRQDGSFTQFEGSVDLVLDGVGGAATERSWSLIRPGGVLASLVDHSIQSQGDIRGTAVFFQNDATSLKKIITRFSERRLQIVLDAIHPLDQAHAALQQVAAGHTRGKVIIRTSR